MINKSVKSVKSSHLELQIHCSDKCDPAPASCMADSCCTQDLAVAVAKMDAMSGHLLFWVGLLDENSKEDKKAMPGINIT